MEFSDNFLTIYSNGDKVPPAYHGWLSHAYDDFPTKTGPSNFVKVKKKKINNNNNNFIIKKKMIKAILLKTT